MTSTGQCLLTLAVGFTSFVQFDEVFPSYLNTNIGTYDIGSVCPIDSVLEDVIRRRSNMGVD